MKTLYLDCAMGAAGDMLAAALLELLDDRDAFVAELNALGLPGVEFRAERSVKCGIAGTHLRVTVHGEEEGEQEHDHHPEHHHHHTMADIEAIVRTCALPQRVRDDVLGVYRLIAQAESRVHGESVEEIHFHEVGALDAVADITAVCCGIARLGAEQVVCSPVHVGSGQVRCAHGVLPVPAPAAAELLRGVPIYGGAVRGELCTPTGAALLRRFVTRFGALPAMTPARVGYGMGKKDFEMPNCVRAILGEAGADETVSELRCNVDDMTGEGVGFAMERLLDAGALDVYTVPVGMKKSRPGTLLCVLCRAQDREKILRALFKHTTTLGVRETPLSRYTMTRRVETVQTALGAVRCKVSEGYGVVRRKFEYDDLARLARETGCSLEAVLEKAEKASPW